MIELNTFPDLLARVVIVFTTLFVIIEPFGVVPTFIGLTKEFTDEERRRVILKSTIAGAGILMVFSLIGDFLFQILGLNLSTLRVGGGVLLFLTALDMLQGKVSDCRCSKAELKSTNFRDDISFVPLAIPLLSGPGAITSVMIFSTDHESQHGLHFALLTFTILLCFVISYYVLRSANLISRVLGTSGVSVMQRLMGLILAAVSVQMIFQGAVSLFKAFYVQ